MTAILLPWTGKAINIAYDRLELTFDHKQTFKISSEDCVLDESLFSIFIVFRYHIELRPCSILRPNDKLTCREPNRVVAEGKFNSKVNMKKSRNGIWGRATATDYNNSQRGLK